MVYYSTCAYNKLDVNSGYGVLRKARKDNQFQLAGGAEKRAISVLLL